MCQEKESMASKSRVQQALDALRSGNGVIVIDDDERENEGDLIFPAETLTESQMALLIRECSGIVCLCLTPEKAAELRLTPMVETNTVNMVLLLPTVSRLRKASPPASLRLIGSKLSKPLLLGMHCRAT
ncbi:MAG: 3,4-dihydroxy-2-butanone-4-phosphate synthase [Planctomycetaceae bacterium]|nr:3,4-dihydroxy-2-butanone-4-phosphate synthase [Planctomycetaceae bacterium]